MASCEIASQLEQSVSLFSKVMPFRATRMWNELVKDFETGIRLKKKRWRMKYYHDCFSGSEGIDWMHEYLKTNPSYGSNVTRNQAELLCQRFLEQNVFEDILASCPRSTKPTLEENRLYCFANKSISKRERSKRNLKFSDSKENEHSKPSEMKAVSTRRPTPLLKRRSSFTGNVKDAKRLLREKTCTDLQNLAIEGNSEEKIPKRKPAGRKRGLTDKTNQIVLKNPLIKSKMSHNVQIPSAGSRSLSRKWKSEFDLSSFQGNSCDENPVMELKRLTSNAINAEVTALSTCSKSTTDTCSKSTTDTVQDEYNELWKDVCLERLEWVLNVGSLNEVLDCDSLSWVNVMENIKSDSRQVKEAVPEWLISAMKYLIHWPSIRKDSNDTGPDYPGFQKDVFKTIFEHFESMPDPLLPFSFLDVFTKISGLITKCKLSAIRALQNTLLLLKKCQKQQLQLLLRFMIKISKNQLLNLSDYLATRELVIQTFVPCIFGADKQNTGRIEILGIRITSFIMDNYCEVFKVPDGLQFHVEQRIAFQQRNSQKDIESKPQSTWINSDAIAFCERVTSQEFEEQKKLVTQRCLEQLLDNIIKDERINEKEKKKKLKQFQKTYPEIYFSRFPGDGLSVISKRPSVYRLREVVKPLGLIKNLR